MERNSQYCALLPIATHGLPWPGFSLSEIVNIESKLGSPFSEGSWHGGFGACQEPLAPFALFDRRQLQDLEKSRLQAPLARGLCCQSRAHPLSTGITMSGKVASNVIPIAKVRAPRPICYSHEPRSTLLPTFADVINFIEIHRRQQRHMGDNPPPVCPRPESKHRRSPQPTIPQSSSGRAGPNHLRRPRYHSCCRPCR